MSFLADAAEAGRTLRDDVRVVIAQFGRQDIFFHAGSVAYSALLAGVPFVLLVASALGYFVGATGQASNDAIVRFLRELLPDRTADAFAPIVRGILIDVEAKRTALGLVGAPLFAWFSTRFFGSLRASLTSVFAIDRGRGFWHGKALDMMYVFVGTVLVVAYLVVIAYVSLEEHFATLRQALRLEPDTIGLIEFVIVRVAATAFLFLMFGLLYKFLPSRRVAWRSAAWGALWGVALFELARGVIFEFITRILNPASLYSGTLAALAVVVFWAYYAAAVFIIGGVVARVHEVRDVRASTQIPLGSLDVEA